MLKLQNIHASYGPVAALCGLSLEVPEGAIVTLLGANGAGKTSTLHAIAGILPVSKGTVHLQGLDITGKSTDKITRLGASLVPEHRQLFPNMTVMENLIMGRFIHGLSRGVEPLIARVFELFPELVPKKTARAGMLSGGQQQMLAIGRALMAEPRLLLLDEPSLGLAPLMVDRILEAIRTINASGVTVLLVEQNAHKALPMSSYSYVIEIGNVVLEGPSDKLMNDAAIKASYLGTV